MEGKKFVVEMNLDVSVKELGQELQQLTNIQEDTMRLIVLKISNKTSKLAGTIKMMVVSTNEVEEVLENAKANSRIAGFEEEEKKQEQRSSYGPPISLKLPQGPYIFADFHTLEIPGVVLNPPPSEALKGMHMLAADPGIVAVMNKKALEMLRAEVSPMPIADVLKHEPDPDDSLHGAETLHNGTSNEMLATRNILGGPDPDDSETSFRNIDGPDNMEAENNDLKHGNSMTPYSEVNVLAEPDPNDVMVPPPELSKMQTDEPDPDDEELQRIHDPVTVLYDRLQKALEMLRAEVSPMPIADVLKHEPDPDDSLHGAKTLHNGTSNEMLAARNILERPDPDDSETSFRNIDGPDNMEAENYDLKLGNSMTPCSGSSLMTNNVRHQVDENRVQEQPAHGEFQAEVNVLAEPDPDDVMVPPPELSKMQTDEPDPDDEELQRIHDPVTVLYNHLQKALEMLRAEVSPVPIADVLKHEPDPDDSLHGAKTLHNGTNNEMLATRNILGEPDPDDSETSFGNIDGPDNMEAESNDLKHGNSMTPYSAAMEILSLIGFNEDVIWDELGMAKSYLVLKQNDPGLILPSIKAEQSRLIVAC